MAILERKAVGRNDPSPKTISNVESLNQRDRRQWRRRPFAREVSSIVILFAILNLHRSPSSTSSFVSLDKELIVAKAEGQGGKAIATDKAGPLRTTKDKVGEAIVTKKDTPLQTKKDQEVEKADTAIKERPSPKAEDKVGEATVTKKDTPLQTKKEQEVGETPTDKDEPSPKAKDEVGEATTTKKDTPSQTTEVQDGGEATTATNDKQSPIRKGQDPIATKVEEKVTNGTSLASYSYGTTDVVEFKRLNHEYLLSRQQQLHTSHLSTQAREIDANGKNITSYGYIRAKGFIAGFRNQMMALTMLAIRANHGGHKQLILDHLTFKDTYGSEKFEPFEFFFDVEHWNKYSYNEERLQDNNGLPAANILEPERYPNWLPRLVFYDQSVHDELDPSTKMYRSKEIAANPTRPYGFQKKTTTLFGNYMTYGKGKGGFMPRAADESQARVPFRNPADILLLKGALRPHPALQAVVDRSKEYLREKGQQQGMSGSSTFRYMTLHARVEPDMQKHPVCRDKKVLKLQEIVDMMESKWPEPPVDAVFLPINRQYLEEEGTLPANFKNDTESNEAVNWIAVENLKVLNRITNYNGDEDGKSKGGLWSGRVPVVEFGSEALRGTVYEHRPSLSGAILNYFLALDADIFIGTEVSSYSSDILGSRFYRGSNTEAIDGQTKNSTENNYKYLPGGLEEWLTDDMIVPPNFLC